MKHVYIEDLPKHVGEEVQIKGWLYNRRGKGKLSFLQIRDGSGVVQCVAFKKEMDEEHFKLATQIPQESSVIVRGSVRADERSPGGVEVGLSQVEMVSASAENYPIQIQDVKPDVGFLMKNRHLWLRSRKQAALLRIRADVMRSIQEFFDDRGYVRIDSPIITPAACEGTSTLFGLDYFGDEAFLTQSGQLYAEASAMALGRVYTFGPTFRAEKSKTRKHLTEFWMVEPEVAFMEFDELLELAEQFVSFIVTRALERRKEELKVLERDTSILEKIVPPFPRVHYSDAVKKINAQGIEFPWGEDFGAPHEDAIAKDSDKPVMVHRYPSKIKAFYMEPDPQDDKEALCVDVIAPEGYGEIIGGSQRIHDFDLLERRIKEHDLPREAFEWYLDLRKYGSVPHSGFGLGVERTVAWIAGTEHVRECIGYPRMLHKVYP
ncbi:MAG: asparagine--tRNA ligase [Planctomycetota bacterium]|nr:asparagine--tRNA ligase [Planctomycetota bacterium]